MIKCILTAFILAIVLLENSELFAIHRPPDVILKRSDLDKPVPEWKLYITIFVSHRDSTGTWVRSVILENERFADDDNPALQGTQIERQLKPLGYEWEIKDRMWTAGFIENRDGTFHTIVRLPEKDLEQSVLRLVLPKTIGGDDRVWPVIIAIDMSDFDWSPDYGWRRQ